VFVSLSSTIPPFLPPPSPPLATRTDKKKREKEDGQSVLRHNDNLFKRSCRGKRLNASPNKKRKCPERAEERKKENG
jgi:hypothetical protein